MSHNKKPGCRPAALRHLHEIPAEEIKNALLASSIGKSPMEEMTATVHTAFGLMRKMRLNRQSKDALFRLEMEFDFWIEMFDN